MAFAFVGCNTEKTFSEEPFCSLQSAYNQGWLKREDLEKIAGYHNSKSNSDTLDGKVENAIKQAFLECYRRTGDSEFTVDDVIINRFYGIYNGCAALMMGYADSCYTQACWEETVAGVTFGYGSGQGILVWKSNK